MCDGIEQLRVLRRGKSPFGKLAAVERAVVLQNVFREFLNQSVEALRAGFHDLPRELVSIDDGNMLVGQHTGYLAFTGAGGAGQSYDVPRIRLRAAADYKQRVPARLEPDTPRKP